MKKLLVLLALCMVLAVVMVACETDPSTTDETTAGETTTEATTTEPGETTTEEVTTEPGTETSTEENTTEPGESSSEETTEPVEPEVDPADPVFLFGVQDIVSTATGAPDVTSAVASDDGSYATLTNGTAGDPYFTFRGMNKNARYIAIKYRTTVEGAAFNLFAGSTGTDADGNGDMLAAQNYITDGEWNVAIVDLDPAEKVNEEWLLSFVRYDFYTNGTEQSIDVAWIGAFNAPEYAFEYFVETTYTERGSASWSFDTVYLNGSMYFETDGNAAAKLEAINNTITINFGEAHNELHERGWIGFSQEITAFGYYIEGVTPIIFDESFLSVVPEGDPVKGAGGQYAQRFEIKADLSGLTYGTYTVSIVAKLADGTIVVMYETIVEIKNLTVDPNFGFATSIDQVNGNGPVKEDGSYEANFSAIGGNNTIGKIDAAATGKTTDKNGFLTLGGWCGINGGVNRYMWSVDGGNTWNEVISGGGAERADLVAHFGNIGLTDAATGAYAFSGTDGFIYIDLSAFEGATGTLLVGAIPNSDTNVVVPIAEISNLTIAPVVKTVYFNGENGTVNVPANFETKFFVRAGAAGMTLKIENADKFTITATNFADSFVMEAVDGVITVEVPADWDSFELTIVNNTAEAADAVITLTAPVVVEGDGSVDAPYVMAGTQGTISAEFVTGWESVFYTFTAEADGTLTFAGTENMWVMVEYENVSETVCDNGNGTWAVTAGTTYKFVIGEANWSAGTVEGTWSFAA